MQIVGAAALAGMLIAAPALGAETIPGPIRVDILSVYDGDTFTARAHIWPGHYVETAVRVLGVDTPEIKGRCQSEIDLAIKARDEAARLLAGGVQLVDVRPDKYGGRVDARAILPDGRDLADALIGQGVGRPYHGEKREGWCR